MIVGIVVAPYMLPKIVVERIMYTFGIASEEVTSRHKNIDKNMVQYQKLSSRQKAMAASQLGIEGMGGMDGLGLGLDVDSSTGARFETMNEILNDFPNHPVFGYGVTGYKFTDSQFPKVLIETGIMGLFMFIYLLWITFQSIYVVWKEYRDDPLYNVVSTGTIGAFFGLVSMSSGTNIFIIVRLMEPFWCLVALNVAIPMIEKGESVAKRVSDRNTFSM